jgi:hypothetical protein
MCAPSIRSLNNFFNGVYLVALVIGVIASAGARFSSYGLQRANDEVRLEILEIQRRMAEKGELNPHFHLPLAQVPARSSGSRGA